MLRVEKAGTSPRLIVGVFLVVIAACYFLLSQTMPTLAAGSVIAYWKFDEANAGQMAVDQSSNHNDLTPVGNPQPTTDVPSELDTDFPDPYGVSLNGAGQYFTIPDNSSLDNTAAGMTIAIWVKFNDINESYQSIVSKWNIGLQQQWTLQLNANGKIGWWTGDGGAGADNLESSSTMESDTWYHIIVTSQGLSKKIYINGNLEGSKTSSVTMGVAAGVDVGVGAKTVGSPEYLNGLVDDVRIYSYALSNEEAGNLAGGADVQPTPTLTGGGPVTHEQESSVAITDLQVVTGGTTNPMNVAVKILVSHGTLSMTTTTGLTFKNASGGTLSNPQTGSTLYFSGTMADINTALASLRYSRTSGTGSDTLEASLVDPGQVFFPDNDHLYEYVSVPGGISWMAAKTAAENRTKYGAEGYLATITSANENAFITARLGGAGWMGASDAGGEGAWRWVTGPEANTQFCQGNNPCNSVSSRYTNWNNNEPNNHNHSGVYENCGQFLSGDLGTGKWNDLICDGSGESGILPGYVVEYGGLNDINPTVSSVNVSITTSADATPPTQPGTPSGTSPTVDTTPTISWTASGDSGGGLRNPAYTLEWSTSATFVSTAGSATTNGTSLAPSSGLSDGTWYFRVKATDTVNNTSTSDISDGIIIDTTAPTTPGAPSVSTLANDNTPTWNWDESVDTGAGLAFIAYAVEWSQDTDFAGLGGQAGITENSYVIPDGLAMTDSTWYFRVKAYDAAGNESEWSDAGSITIDTDAPIATNLSPADGAVDVDVNPILEISFNTSVQKGSGSILVKRSSDDTIVATINVNSGLVDIDGDTDKIFITLPVSLVRNKQYYVQISSTAFKDSADNNYAGIADVTTWNFTVIDDTDGVSEATEAGAPNGGDANNDGTPDSEQSKVTSLVNAATGKYAVLAVDDDTCSLVDVSLYDADTVGQDNEYSYPLGLLDFSATCGGAPGFSTTITQYFYDPPAGDFVLRKFANERFSTVADASISYQTIGGHNVMVVSYQVTDGGELDADGVANGTIVDPAGPATSVPGAPNTGFGLAVSRIMLKISIFAMIIFAAASLLFVAYRLGKR